MLWPPQSRQGTPHIVRGAHSCKRTPLQDRHNYTWPRHVKITPHHLVEARAISLQLDAPHSESFESVVPGTRRTRLGPASSIVVACVPQTLAGLGQAAHAQSAPQVQEGPHEQPLSQAVQPTYRGIATCKPWVCMPERQCSAKYRGARCRPSCRGRWRSRRTGRTSSSRLQVV
jgi:hypothetical protein